MVSMLGSAGYNQNMPMEKPARVMSCALAVSTQGREAGMGGGGEGERSRAVIQLKMSMNDNAVIM